MTAIDHGLVSFLLGVWVVNSLIVTLCLTKYLTS